MVLWKAFRQQIGLGASIYAYKFTGNPLQYSLPGKSHGQRSLVGCSPWGHEESDMTERLHFHFSLSCTGEGNGNPLQCSCLENPRDGGAWWAAVFGVAQSRTRLKWLSSSSSSSSTALTKRMRRFSRTINRPNSWCKQYMYDDKQRQNTLYKAPSNCYYYSCQLQRLYNIPEQLLKVSSEKCQF